MHARPSFPIRLVPVLAVIEHKSSQNDNHHMHIVVPAKQHSSEYHLHSVGHMGNSLSVRMTCPTPQGGELGEKTSMLFDTSLQVHAVGMRRRCGQLQAMLFGLPACVRKAANPISKSRMACSTAPACTLI